VLLELCLSVSKLVSKAVSHSDDPTYPLGCSACEARCRNFALFDKGKEAIPVGRVL
jgi:hypothetical protein